MVTCQADRVKNPQRVLGLRKRKSLEIYLRLPLGAEAAQRGFAANGLDAGFSSLVIKNHPPPGSQNLYQEPTSPLRWLHATQALLARRLARPVRTRHRIQPRCEHRTDLDRKRHPHPRRRRNTPPLPEPHPALHPPPPPLQPPSAN